MPILPGYSEEEPEPVTLKKQEKKPEPAKAEPRPHRGAGDRGDSRGGDGDVEEPGFSRIFLNVGRRDGARAQDLQQVLTDVAGIARHDTGRIRIRDRVTFVSVREADLDKAIAALGGRVIGGRTVVAEPAKPRT
jgi:ATP-dependent RNA helicase DeaD